LNNLTKNSVRAQYPIRQIILCFPSAVVLLET